MFSFALPALATDWSAPVAEMAKAIASASGSGTVTLSVVNSSSLSKDQVTDIQRALEARLRSSGLRLEPAASSDVRVTLSENLRAYVWVAEIRKSSDTQVQMVTIPRSSATSTPKNSLTVTVRQGLMWSQSTQILDAILIDASSSNAKMVVLDTEALSLYALRDGKWQREQNWAITHTRPFPRDVRGLLVPGKDRAIEAYLPGTVCSLTANAVVCRDSDDAWKIGPRSAFFNSGRNYFTGALVPASDTSPGPFYSMVWVDKQNSSIAISTGVDGRVRISDGINDRLLPPTATPDWGSDVAAVKSACGSGAQLLVSSAADDDSADWIRAYEFPDRDPVLASAATDFAGPITALWSHDNTSATAVARNLQTGQYEAYSVSITCNQ
jgi:hypothetical protein